MKVSISNGNRKMGAIPSVSLPPITTCPKNAPCAKKCYAMRMCKRYPNVKQAYENNLEIWQSDPIEYFDQVEYAVKFSRYFRFHVSGDIPSLEYLIEVFNIAKRNSHCEILIFTKKYDIVNEYIEMHNPERHALRYIIPSNLHIIFSEWGNMPIPNPYNLPTSAVIFKGEEPKDGWKVCGGNCTECACRGVGCWELKNGETIAFYEH